VERAGGEGERLQVSNKPVSAPGYGFDVPRIVGRVAQRSPELVHGRVQTVFKIDKRFSSPDLFAQLFAGNQFAGMCQQDQQNLERLA
jgi:hypothetical protein